VGASLTFLLNLDIMTMQDISKGVNMERMKLKYFRAVVFTDFQNFNKPIVIFTINDCFFMVLVWIL